LLLNLSYWSWDEEISASGGAVGSGLCASILLLKLLLLLLGLLLLLMV
jgi:hypothetical protein